MTQMNENSMAVPTSLQNVIPCGEYQPKDEKGMLVPAPEFVAIVCRKCCSSGHDPYTKDACNGLPEGVPCDRCGGEGSVLIDKSKLKVMP